MNMTEIDPSILYSSYEKITQHDHKNIIYTRMSFYFKTILSFKEKSLSYIEINTALKRSSIMINGYSNLNFKFV